MHGETVKFIRKKSTKLDDTNLKTKIFIGLQLLETKFLKFWTVFLSSADFKETEFFV